MRENRQIGGTSVMHKSVDAKIRHRMTLNQGQQAVEMSPTMSPPYLKPGRTDGIKSYPADGCIG